MLAANRTALVTGAASGIGAAVARRWGATGARVILLDRDGDAAAAVAADIADATVLVHDLSDPNVVPEIGREVADAGGLAVLVNAAGIVIESDDEHALTRTLAVNLKAAIRLTRQLRPQLRDADAPRVVNIGSVQAERAGSASVAYAASKGGLHAATRALAVDLAGDGILVNAIAPGFIDTPMARLADGTSEYETDWFRSVYVEHARIPLRRPGSAEEVAAAVEFLASASNTYITGTVLAVDGGLGAAL
jgi:3-oxoacyl-[acyl-carrier protein] reductase